MGFFPVVKLLTNHYILVSNYTLKEKHTKDMSKFIFSLFHRTGLSQIQIYTELLKMCFMFCSVLFCSVLLEKSEMEKKYYLKWHHAWNRRLGGYKGKSWRWWNCVSLDRSSARGTTSRNILLSKYYDLIVRDACAKINVLVRPYTEVSSTDWI